MENICSNFHELITSLSVYTSMKYYVVMVNIVHLIFKNNFEISRLKQKFVANIKNLVYHSLEKSYLLLTLGIEL